MNRLLSLSIVKAERSRNPLRIPKGLTIHNSMKSWWYIQSLGNILIIHSCHLWLWEHVMEIFDEVWIRGVFIQSSKVLEESGLLKGPENLFFSSIERTNWISVSFKLTVRQNKILRVRSLGLVKVILIRLNSELNPVLMETIVDPISTFLIWVSETYDNWGRLGTSCLSWSFQTSRTFCPC